MNWLTQSMDEYYLWLKSNTAVLHDGGTDWYAIQTPFSGVFNDLIEIYARRQNGTILLSDNGETLNQLSLVGVSLERKGGRRRLAEEILRNYGLVLDTESDEITSAATPENFPQKKHNFLSALMELHDLQVLSKGNVASLFKEDVRQFLDERQIIYTPDFISKGQTGLEFFFDFQIAGRQEEIVLKAFNTINKQTLSSFLFGWEDIKPVRERSTRKAVRAIAFVNDEEKFVRPDLLDALKTKNAQVILWSERENSANMSRLKAA